LSIVLLATVSDCRGGWKLARRVVLQPAARAAVQERWALYHNLPSSLYGKAHETAILLQQL
jgi:hypothetical protein